MGMRPKAMQVIHNVCLTLNSPLHRDDEQTLIQPVEGTGSMREYNGNSDQVNCTFVT
jgi:hypothetical protein